METILDPAVVDPDLLADGGLAVLMGVALAATCGLRAFLPLLVLSVLALLGKVQPGPAFAWIGSPAAVACFGTAVVLELAGDKFPAVDHALDAVGLVVKPAAGTVAAASLVTGMDPLLACVLGLVTGGVAAGGIHLVKAKVRVLSTLFTAGMGNVFLSVAEDVAAGISVVLSVLLPALVVAALALVAVAAVLVLRERRRKRAARPDHIRSTAPS